MSNPTPDLLKARDNRQSCEDLQARREISSKDLFGSAAAAQGEKMMPQTAQSCNVSMNQDEGSTMDAAYSVGTKNDAPVPLFRAPMPSASQSTLLRVNDVE